MLTPLHPSVSRPAVPPVLDVALTLDMTEVLATALIDWTENIADDLRDLDLYCNNHAETLDSDVHLLRCHLRAAAVLASLVDRPMLALSLLQLIVRLDLICPEGR